MTSPEEVPVASSSPTPVPSVSRPALTSEGRTGIQLILAGILVQAGLTATIFGLFLGLGADRSGAWGELPVVVAAGLGLDVALGIVAILQASAGRYGTAESLALALGILGIPLGLGLVGLIFIAGYVKLSRAAPPPPVGMPSAPGAPLRAAEFAAPTPLAAARSPPTATMPPPPVAAPPCSRCGLATRWVPQYSRYFCYQCRTYV
ncbi:MAG TPA: hypothetical protein VGV89_09315 [Thermoplasmata archaeon]|nr:hypothetical protein [Thermoplasmata archaeon]